MQDFGTKADNSPPPGGQLSAAEFNNIAAENENAVLKSGQALSGASDTQLAQSMFLHAVKSESFQDSGTANAYVVTPISGASGVSLPGAYTAMNGAVISFKAAFSNTGASTINIGQTTGTLIGSKQILTQAGTAIPAGYIVSGQYVQISYNSALNAGAGAWEILPWGLNSGRLIRRSIYRNSAGTLQVSIDGAAYVTASSTFTPLANTARVKALLNGAGGGGGLASSTPAGQISLGSGGAGGGWCEKTLLSGFGGLAIAVGQGGASGANGGSTSFGPSLSAPGGSAGGTGPGAASNPSFVGGTGGSTGIGGDINGQGGNGGSAWYGSTPISGKGGSSIFGEGAYPVGATGSPGNPAQSIGAGGSGGGNGASVATNTLGGTGGSGTLIIEEYSA